MIISLYSAAVDRTAVPHPVIPNYAAHCGSQLN
jgi:hypothetical protein